MGLLRLLPEARRELFLDESLAGWRRANLECAGVVVRLYPEGFGLRF